MSGTFENAAGTPTAYTLAIGNAISGNVSGGILFGNAANNLAQNATKLFWDQTNELLGLGIASSLLARLHVKGAGATSATSSAIFTNANGLVNMQILDDQTILMRGLTTYKNVNNVSSIVGQNGNGHFQIQTNGVNSFLAVNSGDTEIRSSGNNNNDTKAIFSNSSASNIGAYITNNLAPTILRIRGVNNGIAADFTQTGGGTPISKLTLYNTSIATIDLNTGGTSYINGGGLVIGNTAINASAIFQTDSTTKGMLPPRMTTAQKNAIAAPVAALLLFDTTLNKLCVYNGAAWETVTSI